MKQEVYHPVFLSIARILSAVIYPVWRLFSHPAYNPVINQAGIKTILVLEYHCIGDVILVSSTLTSLKNCFPDAHIVLVTNNAVCNLAKTARLADDIIPFEAPWIGNLFSWQSWKKTLALVSKLRSDKFDLGLDFKGDIRGLIFLSFVNPRYRIGYTATGGKFLLTHPTEFPFHLHQVERASNLLERNGIIVRAASPRISISNHGQIKTDHVARIVIHTGASHLDRQWPVKYWIKLIQLLVDQFTVVIIADPDEPVFAKQFSVDNTHIEVFNGSLTNLAIFLKDCKLLIGVDSMAVHLAIAVGIEGLAIFGSQNPDLTKPFGPHGYYIKPKKPCSHHRRDWRLCHQCMESVTPEVVYKKVTDILNFNT